MQHFQREGDGAVRGFQPAQQANGQPLGRGQRVVIAAEDDVGPRHGGQQGLGRVRPPGAPKIGLVFGPVATEFGPDGAMDLVQFAPPASQDPLPQAVEKSGDPPAGGRDGWGRSRADMPLVSAPWGDSLANPGAGRGGARIEPAVSGWGLRLPLQQLNPAWSWSVFLTGHGPAA